MTETKAAYCYFTKPRDFLCQITNVGIEGTTLKKKEHNHSQNKRKLQKLGTNLKNEVL